LNRCRRDGGAERQSSAASHALTPLQRALHIQGRKADGGAYGL
jgi:hypothetical protein